MLIAAMGEALSSYDQQQKGKPMAGRILSANRPRNSPQQPGPFAASVPLPARTRTSLTLHTGDKVLWNGYTGTFLRETTDDHAEVLIGTRTYRLRKAELRAVAQ